MRITIVGGGNIGTQFAVHCAEKGHDVIVYTSKPELFEGPLNIVNEEGTIIHRGVIKLATADPKEGFGDAELIFITVPATMMQSVAEEIYEYSDKNAMIGVVPGNGGSECAFHRCIKRGNVFFGIERVPAIARLIEKGKTVRSTGYRNELHVAALPKKYAKKCAELVSSIFDKKTIAIPDYLNLTMTPSNPILHTTRLRTIFQTWHEGVVYDSIPLFYEDWNNESSELLIACDEEVQSICRALPEFKMQYVMPLTVYYESPTVEAMTKKISSIEAFKGLATPTVIVNGGIIPDLHSRYFTADFSYGLAIIKQIADFVEVQATNIDSIMAWYRNIAIEKKEFCFRDYNITDIMSFKEFYLI